MTRGPLIERLPPANEDLIRTVERDLGLSFPAAYREFLARSNGVQTDDRLILYAAEELAERNETFSVPSFFPGHLAVGDDSGGKLILVPTDDPAAKPWLVGAGALMPDDGRILAPDWSSWDHADFPLD